jgi:hypothetical protein
MHEKDMFSSSELGDHADRRTDMTKLTVSFRNFTNTPALMHPQAHTHARTHARSLADARTRVPSPMRARTHTPKCVMFIACPQQQWFRKRASMLGYTYIACLVLPLHAMKAYGKVKVQLHSFMISTLDGRKWPGARSDYFTQTWVSVGLSTGEEIHPNSCRDSNHDSSL